jgi:hypothetical protein
MSRKSSIKASAPGMLDGAPNLSLTDQAWADQGDTNGVIGNLVLVPPAGRDDTGVSLRVTLGVGKSADACGRGGPSCIVATRSFRYLPNKKLRVPVGLLIVSDPLFFPGCGWKLPLALRQCTHRFRETALDELPLSDLPALLCEYQIMARAWLEGQGLGGEAEEPPKPRDAIVIAPPPPPATPPVVAAPSAAYAASALLSGRDSSPLSSHTRMRFAQISAAAEALLRQPAPSKQAPSASAAALLRSLLGPTERESGGSYE